MQNIVSLFIAAVAVLFPIYFWAYALKILWESMESVRFKFWTGVFSWLVSVGAIFVPQTFFPALPSIVFFTIFLLFFWFFTLLLTKFGSKFSRSFIQKSSFLHLCVIAILFILIALFSRWVTGSWVFSGIIASLFIPAFLEEISKHFSILWLLGKKFSFSLREISLFAFCVVLGFVFVENILYLQKFGNSISLAIFRSIFTFAVHLLASLICVFAWWKSLSYTFGSWKYLLLFSCGFLLAVWVHFLANMALESGKVVVLLPLSIASYWLFAYFIKK